MSVAVKTNWHIHSVALSEKDTAGNCYFTLSDFISSSSLVIHMEVKLVQICKSVTLTFLTTENDLNNYICKL